MIEFMFLVQIAIFCAVAWYVKQRDSISIYHPVVIYLAYHFLVFVLRPILAYYYNYDMGLYRLYGFLPNEDVKVTALAASSLGLVAFSYFCVEAGQGPMQFMPPEKLRYENNRIAQTLIAVLVVLAPIVIYSALTNRAYNFSEFGSGTTFNLHSGRSLNTGRNGYLTEAQLMAIPICALVGWIFRFRLISLAPLLMFIAFNLGMTKRGPLISAIIAFALLYAYQKRIKVPNFKIIVLILVTSLVFRFAGDYRTATLGQAIQGNIEKTSDEGDGFLQSMDYAGTVFLEYIVNVVPEKSGTYDYFLDNLEVPVAPIPRVMWPGKPEGPPIVRIDLFKYGYPIGMTKSLPGEGWFAWGWFGVAIWCGLAGQLLGMLYRRFASGRTSLFETLGYMCFLASLIIGYRDGQLVSLLRQSIWFIVPVAIGAFVDKARGGVSYERAFARLRNRVAASATPQSLSLKKLNEMEAFQALPPAVQRRRVKLAQSADQK